MKQFPTIKTENYILRQISDNDLENVFHGLSHPDVIKYYGISFSTLEATKEQIAWFKNLEETQTGAWWAICSKYNDFLGAGGLNSIDNQHKKAEIGFWLLPEYWGKEIMKEAMPVICKYGFEEFDLHRIEGFVDSENQKCKKALSKLNFIYEGTMRDCERKNGKYVSIDIYSLIRKE